MPLLTKWPCVLITTGHTMLWHYPKPTWILAWVEPAGVGMGPWGFTCTHMVAAYGQDPYLARGLGSRPDTYFGKGEGPSIKDHPVAKPFETWQWFLNRGSPDKGETVLDPFVGSGTTIIAAEKLGRRCYAMEIEPRYVDVAIRRWEDFTGQNAVLLESPRETASDHAPGPLQPS